MSQATADSQFAQAGFSDRKNPLRAAWRVARAKPLGTVSLATLVGIGVAAVLAPVLSTHDPDTVDYANILAGLNTNGHLLGTDEIGRDVFSRLLHGATFSMRIAIASTVLGLGLGTFIGLTSGWFGGLYDLFIQRVIDTMQAFPGILLALALVSVLPPSSNNIIIAIAVGIIPGSSRVVRGVTMAIRSEPYMDAAVVIGATTPRIMIRHVLPNIMAPIIVIIALYMGVAILIEASLTFLGVAPLDAPSWGAMLSGSGRAYLTEAPHLAIVPGVAITMTVLSLNLLGDTLRDVLDPRMRGSR